MKILMGHVPFEKEPCAEHLSCDECHHGASHHINLHDQVDPDWSTATCWAESVCDLCQESAS